MSTDVRTLVPAEKSCQWLSIAFVLVGLMYLYVLNRLTLFQFLIEIVRSNYAEDQIYIRKPDEFSPPLFSFLFYCFCPKQDGRRKDVYASDFSRAT